MQVPEAGGVIQLNECTATIVDGYEQAWENGETILRGPNPPLLRLKP
jgi:hypothetical protein